MSINRHIVNKIGVKKYQDNKIASGLKVVYQQDKIKGLCKREHFFFLLKSMQNLKAPKKKLGNRNNPHKHYSDSICINVAIFACTS